MTDPAGTLVSSDVRRFVYFRWRLLEIPDETPIELVRAWRQIHGFLPPWPLGAVAGYSFRLAEGVRGVRITRPEQLQVQEAIERRLLALLQTKHQVEEVRLARRSEAPVLARRDRVAEPQEWRQVEQWPTLDRHGDPLVAELAMSPGVYLSSRSAWGNTSPLLDDAITFDDVAEAEQYLAALGPGLGVTLRYRSACVAEGDQREAASVDGKAMIS